MSDKDVVARLFKDAENVVAGINRDLPHILARGYTSLLERQNKAMGELLEKYKKDNIKP